MTTPTSVFYDCEAFDLEGYPIEVDCVFTDVATAVVASESHLIKSLGDWPFRENWDRAAERLHGIALAQLRRCYRPVWAVAQHMKGVLGERELLSDAPQDEHS